MIFYSGDLIIGVTCEHSFLKCNVLAKRNSIYLGCFLLINNLYELLENIFTPCQKAKSMILSMVKNFNHICLSDEMIMQLIQTCHLCHFITTMILIVYTISYHFHNYNHKWMIIILENHAIMVFDLICNIKSNNSHGKCIQIIGFNFRILELKFQN